MQTNSHKQPVKRTKERKSWHEADKSAKPSRGARSFDKQQKMKWFEEMEKYN